MPANVLRWVSEEHDESWHVCMDGSRKKIRKEPQYAIKSARWEKNRSAK